MKLTLQNTTNKSIRKACWRGNTGSLSPSIYFITSLCHYQCHSSETHFIAHINLAHENQTQYEFLKYIQCWWMQTHHRPQLTRLTLKNYPSMQRKRANTNTWPCCQWWFVPSDCGIEAVGGLTQWSREGSICEQTICLSQSAIGHAGSNTLYESNTVRVLRGFPMEIWIYMDYIRFFFQINAVFFFCFQHNNNNQKCFLSSKSSY